MFVFIVCYVKSAPPVSRKASVLNTRANTVCFCGWAAGLVDDASLVDEERMKEAEMKAERNNRTAAVLQSIATFQSANESSESPPVNASDFAKAATALVEAWNEESAAFFQAKARAKGTTLGCSC